MKKLGLLLSCMLIVSACQAQENEPSRVKQAGSWLLDHFNPKLYVQLNAALLAFVADKAVNEAVARQIATPTLQRLELIGTSALLLGASVGTVSVIMPRMLNLIKKNDAEKAKLTNEIFKRASLIPAVTIPLAALLFEMF